MIDDKELRTMLQQAAKIAHVVQIGYDTERGKGVHAFNGRDEFFWNPYASTHDSAWLRIDLGIDIEHQPDFNCVCAFFPKTYHDQYLIEYYPADPTMDDIIACERLVVLRVACALPERYMHGR